MGWGAGGSCTPRPPIRQQPLSEPRVITVVFLGLLLDLLAFTLLLPLLPGLLESHGRAHVSPPPCLEAPRLPRRLPTAPKPIRDSPSPCHTSLFPRIPSMAPGNEAWTGLPQPSGCQRRRGTTVSCLEVRPQVPRWGPCPHFPAAGHCLPPSRVQCPLLVGPTQHHQTHEDRPSRVTQTSVSFRSDRLSLLLPAGPLGTSHGGCLRLSREAPGDAAVPGTGAHLSPTRQRPSLPPGCAALGAGSCG